jgi:hypothetical protein
MSATSLAQPSLEDAWRVNDVIARAQMLQQQRSVAESAKLLEDAIE